MKKRLLILAAAALLATGSAFAQTVIRVAPPAPVVEVRPVAPGPRYVWTGGYYRWYGGRYIWAPGRWVYPPRAGVVWVPGHWTARQGGWVWISGHWR
jgi:hypothetical protein